MFSMFSNKKTTLPTREQALPGRKDALRTAERHLVLGTPMRATPAGCEEIVLGLGCFWGAERKLWQQPGVVTTAAGYAGGFTENPTYEETCTGQTGHTEVVRVVYDPTKTTLATLLKVFFENHDPTQGMRQGNDVGSVYRSAVYWNSSAQRDVVLSIKSAYEAALKAKGMGAVTTEVRPMSEAGPFYYAEDYHQQYLQKNPKGYCGLAGTGVSCPVGTGVSAG